MGKNSGGVPKHRRSRKKRGTKEDAIEVHSLRRAWERFGFLESDLAAIIAKIQNGATLLQRQSNRVGVYHVPHKGNDDVAAVYDRQRKMIVTLLYASTFVRDEDLDPALLSKGSSSCPTTSPNEQ